MSFDSTTPLNQLTDVLDDTNESFKRAIGLLTRGPRHRDRLAAAETRIVVSGIRGKSGTARRLHDVFDSRGSDVYAKITGDRPLSIRNGEVSGVEREGRVTLYENVEELAGQGLPDVIVMENQAITDYTTRLFNARFADPDVVFLVNVRQDHRDTLGGDRFRIARAFARSIREGTHVVSGEGDPEIRAVLDAELDRRDATVTHVDVPDEHADVPGAETVYGLNDVLRAAGQPPLSDRAIERYLDELRVEWTQLPDGRVFNAAAVNDVESTEVVRESLAGDEVVEPVLYLRGDRRARTDAFADYLDDCYERGLVEQVRVVGDDTDTFDRKTDVPVEVHDESTDAGAVLDAALATDRPVVLMGNTVSTFMRDLRAEIDDRSAAAEADAKRAKKAAAPTAD